MNTLVRTGDEEKMEPKQICQKFSALFWVRQCPIQAQNSLDLFSKFVRKTYQDSVWLHGTNSRDPD